MRQKKLWAGLQPQQWLMLFPSYLKRSKTISFYVMFFALNGAFQLNCSDSNLLYEERISLSSIDPNKRPCNRHYECNNLLYQGLCRHSLCTSSKRITCANKGQKRLCKRPAQEELCVEGVQSCQPLPFVQRVWGDCLITKKSLRKRCTKSCKNHEVRECYLKKKGCWLNAAGQFTCYRPCSVGIQRCESNVWSKCFNQITPKQEICNGKDDDCDGVVDETQNHQPLQRPCYEGSSQTRGRGSCRSGFNICEKNDWSSCIGQIKANKETCNGRDDNCNGTIDEKAFCASGICIYGKCQQNSEERHGRTDAGVPEAQKSDVKPFEQVRRDSEPLDFAPEFASDGGVQESMISDQRMDEHSSVTDQTQRKCRKGASEACYSAQPKTRGVGSCHSGTRLCHSDGYWEECINEVTPQPEKCDGKDNDCNGQIDDGKAHSTLKRNCFKGASKNRNKGTCRDGIQFCIQKSWGKCYGSVVPKSEVCNSRDDDCNGKVDDKCKR